MVVEHSSLSSSFIKKLERIQNLIKMIKPWIEFEYEKNDD